MAETLQAQLTWVEGMRFVASAGSGHDIVTESVGRPGHLGPSPMELFVIGIAGCTAIDVVAILRKMREPLTGLAVATTATRASDHPKRITAIEFAYTVRGRGLSREKVERAVDLSQCTYCSALASLREDCKVSSRVEILDD
jgi:putative redox protein